MKSFDSRYWLRREDLAKLLNKNDEEFSAFCEQIHLVPATRSRGPNKSLSFFDAQVRTALEASGVFFPDHAQRISCMMCKGGVGKTTTAYFLATRLASFGAKILVIDSDPQGNLTNAFRPMDYGFTISENSPVLTDVLTGQCVLEEAIIRLTEHLHLLPSTAYNSVLERKLLQSKEFGMEKFDEILSSVDGNYDYVIIDCAPSLNTVNASVIYASDLVLLPVQLDEFSRSGLKLTLSEIADLQREFNFKTEVRVLLNRFNPNEKLTFLYLGHLAAKYRPIMMRSTIRQSAEIKLSLTLKRDMFGRTKSNSKDDFDGLAREILSRTTGRDFLNG
jgi:chromosome partitioning protein